MKQISLNDSCKALSLRDTVAIVGLTNEFQCLNIADSSSAVEMYLPQTIGSHLIDPLDVIHLEKELLICYNSLILFFSFFKKKRKRKLKLKFKNKK